MYKELLGYIAAILTTVAFIPQALLVYKTKNTDSISLSMFFIFTLGVITWALYGFVISQPPVYIANGCTFFLSVYILYMKLTEGKRKKEKS